MPPRSSTSAPDVPSASRYDRDHPRYKWIALSNTTVGMLLATVNSSIVLISLPAIFRGIELNPLDENNVSYLLWMIMGFLLVSAVLVVTFGRLGDMYGRVRLYNLGFVIFTISSVALSLDPAVGDAGALWLIGWRVVQGIGGSMVMANSTAILTDAFPNNQRGMALGINQVAAIAGSFIGLVLGGLLSEWHWRAVFWVSVPLGIIGTVWSYRSLRELSKRETDPVDWLGNITFGVGLGVLLAAITYGIQPYGGRSTGWTNPWVVSGLVGGVVLLAAFVVIETRVKFPMFQISLFTNKVFAAGNFAGLLSAIGRGGMQFMLIIWLQGIWLPRHGYDYESTPLWAGIYLLPVTIGFLVAGPVSGWLSDRFGSKQFAVGGLLLVAASFVGLLLIPVNFPYWVFALLTLLNGIGSGLFSSPNTAAVMGAVPADQRGVASGMRAMFLNAGSALSIGVFFSLMIAGLSSHLPQTLDQGLQSQGVSPQIAGQVAQLPPVGTLFAAFLGFNPLAELLGPTGALDQIPAANAATLTGKEYFPALISEPFHNGLVVVFVTAALMMVVAALASLVGGSTGTRRLAAAAAAADGGAAAAAAEDLEADVEGAVPLTPVVPGGEPAATAAAGRRGDGAP
ncbi:MFS transporter [Cryptosporangium sp. NPDC051539]|uniref:MFS transporter n=1 Tax=Cryptosporangium sp. NPDC051539 TaxID=3363962 RepID=UPI00379BCE26